MTKYFLICASKDHVTRGIKADIAQAGHGRQDLISKLSKGDWIVYYSAKDKFEAGKLLQKFTALGQVADDKVYQPEENENFKPYRRNVIFTNVEDAHIRPLLEKLSFIKNKKKWGFYLMSGFREIIKEDFEVIKNALQKKNEN